MNQDDVIRMAREAGAGEPKSLFGRTDYIVMTHHELERFAALVAAHEREECAKEIQSELNDEIDDEAYCILVALLARVRARGQA